MSAAQFPNMLQLHNSQHCNHTSLRCYDKIQVQEHTTHLESTLVRSREDGDELPVLSGKLISRFDNLVCADNDVEVEAL